ncbi:MAG TPA: YiiX/YebB-like N1pC/P60 family cysteine hydrolase [Acidobacteriota bacterium]|nr:YiiX/YebB-like N1pC/P60 family cysteine hydrolase [Acidobacteriota bacterium]HQQ45812.1 YiiX/YebB-like N1pC/P60 family cysteine hydrolase [Acidobacteriota bacterium]
MAEILTRRQIGKLPVVPYARIRKELQTGDLLFASGNYLISKLIREFTKSPWSHVGIIFPVKSPGGALLLESVEDRGVSFLPLGRYLFNYHRGRPYNGPLVIARVRGLRKKNADKLGRFGIDKLARHYDHSEIARIVARIVAGRGRKTRDNEYICSELVYECFLRAGIEFKYDKRGFISPQNIWEDERVEMGWRVL